ncbi:DNA replication/repair protein RecF [Aliikangiella maris]|uniref:DNA replication and repair protein RecF n=2 Tax=Aliikangiella maris TaxID=3162458 RepID=A0ABV2BX53_9GAMM
MYFKALQYRGLRNLKPGKITFDRELNIFFGDNGAGKSSILEAIALIASGRSFRTNKFELIANHADTQFTLFAQMDDQTKVGLGYTKANKKREIRLNGETINSLSALSKIYPTQVLSPESYHLIDSGPAERRKYIDWCLFHVKHDYHEYWKKYNQVLQQRNALLKSIKYKGSSKAQLDSWNSQLCSLSNIINRAREDIIEQLEYELNKIIIKLDAEFCNELKIGYYPGYSGMLDERLVESLESDIRSGTTKYGAHRADIRLKVEQGLVKDYFSRGQKKIIINALFLAQTAVLKRLSNKDSLFLLDDFTSELDEQNQRSLLELLFQQKNVQTMLSCLQRDSLSWLKNRYNSTHMFHVEHGTISPINE